MDTRPLEVKSGVFEPVCDKLSVKTVAFGAGLSIARKIGSVGERAVTQRPEMRAAAGMDLRRRLIVRANRVKGDASSCGRLDPATCWRRYRCDVVTAPLPPRSIARGRLRCPAASRWADRVAGAAPARERLGIVGAAEADETIELSHLL